MIQHTYVMNSNIYLREKRNNGRTHFGECKKIIWKNMNGGSWADKDVTLTNEENYNTNLTKLLQRQYEYQQKLIIPRSLSTNYLFRLDLSL